jgi:hypothetical protein
MVVPGQTTEKYRDLSTAPFGCAQGPVEMTRRFVVTEASSNVPGIGVSEAFRKGFKVKLIFGQ